MDAAAVARVCRFNRTVTQRLGVLTGSYLSRGRPTGQARLLSYASRLLRTLVADGLVVVEPRSG